MNILITGGAGFIGSAVCRLLASDHRCNVVNLDKLTYAANLNSLRGLEDKPNYSFVRGDICDNDLVRGILEKYAISAVLHLAAESHVDRSIANPEAFIESNVVGTFRLLNATLEYWRHLPERRRDSFRFVHVSTDEVFGDLPFESGIFTEDSPYRPSSPYSASKAASDHLARAWYETYGLPAIVTNCSNNFGPYQHPEKLVPVVILNALRNKPIPIYGEGRNVRDWLYVEDHAWALKLVLEWGAVGERYNIGGEGERTNLELAWTICAILDEEQPRPDGRSYGDQIAFVEDRLGHDRRYAIDATKIRNELGWRPLEPLEQNLRNTVRWYLDNEWWWTSAHRKTPEPVG